MQTITHDTDGTVTTEMKEIKSGRVIRREAYKDGGPVGYWIYQHSNGIDTLDYDFTLRYTDKECTNGVLHSRTPQEYFTNNDSLNYVAPKLPDGYSDPYVYVKKNITYPSFAKEHSIEGIVVVKFTVTYEGRIEDVSVIKSAHKVLDKEVVRVIRNLKLASGASLNGIGQSICVTLPVMFRLDR